MVYRSDDVRKFRNDYLNWFWGSYTAVYLGVGVAAYNELRGAMHARQPQDYAQPLAYHPDVRRHVADRPTRQHRRLGHDVVGEVNSEDLKSSLSIGDSQLPVRW